MVIHITRQLCWLGLEQHEKPKGTPLSGPYRQTGNVPGLLPSVLTDMLVIMLHTIVCLHTAQDAPMDEA